jgi:hypothetical protein
MCRNIKILFNFDPPATDDEVRAASLQFAGAFAGGVYEVAKTARVLIDSLVTNAPARDRDEEAAKAKERSIKRFGTA